MARPGGLPATRPCRPCRCCAANAAAAAAAFTPAADQLLHRMHALRNRGQAQRRPGRHPFPAKAHSRAARCAALASTRASNPATLPPQPASAAPAHCTLALPSLPPALQPSAPPARRTSRQAARVALCGQGQVRPYSSTSTAWRAGSRACTALPHCPCVFTASVRSRQRSVVCTAWLKCRICQNPLVAGPHDCLLERQLPAGAAPTLFPPPPLRLLQLVLICRMSPAAKPSTC